MKQLYSYMFDVIMLDHWVQKSGHLWLTKVVDGYIMTRILNTNDREVELDVLDSAWDGNHSSVQTSMLRKTF
jgi:hypothetical protein